EQGCDSLGVLRQRFAAERVRALLPEGVGLHRVTLPGQRAAALRAALPYALEERLSQELDDLHIVMGPRRSDGRVSAAVVEHSVMTAWTERFAQAGLRVEALLPLAALYADQAPSQGLRLQTLDWPQAPGWLVCAGDEEPVLLEQALLPFWLGNRLQTLAPEQRVLEAPASEVDALQACLPADTRLVTAPPTESAVSLQQQLSAAAPFNLLTGPYAVSMAAPPWRKLRPVMAAAGVVLLLSIGWLGAERAALVEERDALRSQIDATFSRALPGARMQDPLVQFQQQLQGSSGQVQAGAGMLLHAFFASVKGQAGVEIRQLRGSVDALEVELKVASFAELEKLRAALAGSAGITESLEGADSENGGVSARIRIARSES
ncbi:MAG TPA: hypothetical protein EYH51_09275, partial [Pseudomonas pachastrellae]|nr:hypothetical protein [Halopseudomonas pachastrellae]